MTDVETLIHELAEAWTDRDRARVAELFDEEAVFVDMALGLERYGRDQILELFEQGWAAMHDLKVEVLRVVSAGEWLASEWELTGTHTGDLPDLAATGRSIQVRAASFTHVRDGRIVHHRDYYDRASYLAQLGVLEEDGPEIGL